MLEDQGWDSISTALAHCELCTSLVKLSAASILFLLLLYLFIYFCKDRAAKPFCLTERLLGTCE